jgi:hypothetical protein
MTWTSGNRRYHLIPGPGWTIVKYTAGKQFLIFMGDQVMKDRSELAHCLRQIADWIEVTEDPDDQRMRMTVLLNKMWSIDTNFVTVDLPDSEE